MTFIEYIIPISTILFIIYLYTTCPVGYQLLDVHGINKNVFILKWNFAYYLWIQVNWFLLFVDLFNNVAMYYYSTNCRNFASSYFIGISCIILGIYNIQVLYYRVLTFYWLMKPWLISSTIMILLRT